MPSSRSDRTRSWEEGLATVESCWRTALSELVAKKPESAQSAIREAGQALTELVTLSSQFEAVELAAFNTKLHQLSALHKELVRQSRAGQERIQRELVRVKKGGRTLRAYAPGRPSRHQFHV